MFEVGAVTLMEQAEVRTAAQGDFTDVDLNVTLDTGDPDLEATANRVLFSRKLHYLISQLVKDSQNLLFARTKIRMVARLGGDFTRSSRCQELRGARHF